VIQTIPRFKSLFRTSYFLPVVASIVAVGVLWQNMYHPMYGIANDVLRRLGLPPQPWLYSIETALPSMILTSVWKSAGYSMIILIAGLQEIPEPLYESAKIDGAGVWSRFRNITLPMLKPVILFLTVTGLIGSFQGFVTQYIMSNASGGPAGATTTMVFWIYTTAFTHFKMGRACAYSVILFLIILAITLIQLKIFKRGGIESYWG